MERKVSVGLFNRTMDIRIQRGEGVVGRVWESEAPLVVNDYSKWPHRVPSLGIRENVIRAVASVPLKSEPGIAGVIGVAHTTDSERTFGEAEVELLQGFAQLASIALDNANLFAQAEQRTHQIEALYQGDQELYRHLELNDVLQTLVNVAVDILKVDKSVLLVWNEARTHLVPRAARGFEQQTLARMVIEAGQGLVGYAAEHATPVTVNDTVGDRRVDWDIIYPEHIRSFIHVPIIVEGQVFGIFNVNYREPQAFGEEDVRLVLAIAQRAASAIENARLYQRAQSAAVLEERNRLARELHDSVTQQLFSMTLTAQAARAQLERNPQRVAAQLERLQETATAALAEMRALIFQLRPPALRDQGLVAALQQHAQLIAQREEMGIGLGVLGDERLARGIEQPIFRIVQEALNNVCKHAAASHVQITLEFTAEAVVVRVRDDGTGFDPLATPSSAGRQLGILGMRERAAEIGGSLALQSIPGSGTEVVVRVPRRSG
jgi:signal transduction histidine kinase